MSFRNSDRSLLGGIREEDLVFLDYLLASGCNEEIIATLVVIFEKISRIFLVS